MKSNLFFSLLLIAFLGIFACDKINITKDGVTVSLPNDFDMTITGDAAKLFGEVTRMRTLDFKKGIEDAGGDPTQITSVKFKSMNLAIQAGGTPVVGLSKIEVFIIDGRDGSKDLVASKTHNGTAISSLALDVVNYELLGTEDASGVTTYKYEWTLSTPISSDTKLDVQQVFSVTAKL